jgi:hypothetical protein
MEPIYISASNFNARLRIQEITTKAIPRKIKRYYHDIFTEPFKINAKLENIHQL